MREKLPRWLTANPGLKIWALLIALFLWFHVTTEKEVEDVFKIHLDTFGVPENLVLTDNPPKFAQVTIRGRAKEILRLKLYRGLLGRLDLSTARRGEIAFPLSQDMVVLPTWTAAQVSHVVGPRELRLNFDRKMEKLVDVVPIVEGSPREGYLQVGEPIVAPSSISLVGGRRQVRYADSLETEPVDISGLTNTLEKKLRVVPPEGFGFSCQPESVLVTVSIEEVIEKTFANVPVEILNPPTISAEVDPPYATVVISGPRSRVEGLPLEELSVTIMVEGLTDDTLSPTVKFPQGLSLVSIEPELYKVRK